MEIYFNLLKKNKKKIILKRRTLHVHYLFNWIFHTDLYFQHEHNIRTTFWCFHGSIPDFMFRIIFQFLHSVNKLYTLTAMSITVVAIHCCSLSMHDGGQLLCLCGQCIIAQLRMGAFMRMCYAMHTSTLLHNQIMPVFISRMINGLSPMEVGSAKDSFGYLTIFYV